MGVHRPARESHHDSATLCTYVLGQRDTARHGADIVDQGELTSQTPVDDLAKGESSDRQSQREAEGRRSREAAGRDGTQSLARMLTIGFGVVHFVVEVDGSCDHREGEEGARDLDQNILLIEDPGGQGRGDDKEVLTPTAAAGPIRQQPQGCARRRLQS